MTCFDLKYKELNCSLESKEIEIGFGDDYRSKCKDHDYKFKSKYLNNHWQRRILRTD